METKRVYVVKVGGWDGDWVNGEKKKHRVPRIS